MRRNHLYLHMRVLWITLKSIYNQTHYENTIATLSSHQQFYVYRMYREQVRQQIFVCVCVCVCVCVSVFVQVCTFPQCLESVALVHLNQMMNQNCLKRWPGTLPISKSNGLIPDPSSCCKKL